ncbi:MAG: hypothetical protein KKE20_05945 [Nanoarchaeota archaeon]|nr:hypothetical protein [Nanoarchaeota archaeon]
MSKEDENQEREVLSDEKKRRLENLLRADTDLSNRETDSVKKITSTDLGISPSSMIDSNYMNNIIDEMKGLENQLKDYMEKMRPGSTKTTETVYDIVDKEVTVTEPRTFNNLFGLLWGWPDMYHGREYTKTEQVKVGREVTKELNPSEIRQKLREIIHGYVTKLGDYKDEMKRMLVTIDTSIESVGKSRVNYTFMKNGSVSNGQKAITEVRTIESELQDIADKLSTIVREGDDCSVLETFNYELGEKMKDWKVQVKTSKMKEGFYNKAESLMKAYESGLKDVKRAAGTVAEFVTDYADLTKRFLEAENDTSKIAEIMGSSFQEIQFSLKDVSALVGQFMGLYMNVMAGGSVFDHGGDYVANADKIQTKVKESADNIEKEYQEAVRYLESRSRPIKSITQPGVAYNLGSPGSGSPAASYQNHSDGGNGGDGPPITPSAPAPGETPQ